MKGVKAVQRALHTRYLSLLNLYRFTQQPAFEHAYEVVDSTERAEADRLISLGDQEKLTQWTKLSLRKHKSYELLDVRYLRCLAQESNIHGYATMGKLELVSRLQINGSERHNEQGTSSRASSGDGNSSHEVRLDQVGKLSSAGAGP